MSERLRVGVIGTGGMGARHAENLHTAVPDAQLVAVMDVDVERAEEVAAPVEAVVYDDAAALIASDGVEAVVIASPDRTHGALTRACLEAGKPVLVEKPLAVDPDEAARIVDLELRLGRRLIQVGLMRRYDQEHVALARQLAAGAVGAPLMFRGWHRNPPDPTPPTSTEVLVQAAVHDLYSARWLMDREISQVHVMGTTINPARTEHLDLQLISFRMEGGALGIIEVNKDSGFGYEVGVEITGDAGIISTPPHHAPVIRRDGMLGQTVDADWLERFEAAYVLELRAWAAAAARGSATGPSAWDGYLTLEVCAAGVRSLELRASVDIDNPSRPALYTDDA